jgi:pimeloyl-ACP methyl ester carboxylesterase
MAPSFRLATALKKLRLNLFVLLGTLGVVQAQTQPSPTKGVEFSPCQLEDAAHFSVLPAECGWLEVAENPAAPAGRKIKLHIARVPAINRRKAEDPLFILAGGPGMAASTMYAGTAAAFARIQRNRDIVLVDQRGTGQSNALECSFDDEKLMRSSATETEAETARCLAELGKHADVTYYTTSVAVRDLDHVREVLGYQRINLYGASYGTRVAEHYLRRFPDHARAVILDGVVAPEQALGPQIAIDAENALVAVLKRCADNAACAERFGNSFATYQSLRDSLQAHPVAVDFIDPTTGTKSHLDFGSLHFATVLRLSTYTSEQAATLPLMLNLAHSGNFTPLAGQFVLMLKTYGEVLAYGMHNSVVCTEDVPFYSDQNIDRTRIEKTFLGLTQLESLQSLCKGWPRGPLDPDLHARVDSTVPVLLLSGGNDPVTPPGGAEQARAGLKHSVHIVLEGQGHGQLGAPCMDRVMAQFIERGAVEGLDTSCTKSARPMPFFLSPAGPAP